MKEAKQVIVMRKFKCRTGKLIAQGSHSSLGVILQEMRKNQINHPNGDISLTLDIKKDSAMDCWINGRFTKICVYVNTEEELINVYNKAKAKNLPCVMITDAGLTEFHNIPTNTCIAIGPCFVEEFEGITDKLPLY